MRYAVGRWLGALRAGLTALVWILIASTSATAQTAGAFEGIFSVIWGDPRPGGLIGATLYNLTLADGRVVPVQVDPSQRNAAVGAFGKRVAIQGRMTQNAAGADSIVADSIEITEPAKQSLEPNAATVKRALYILVKYKGDTQTPHSPGFFKALTNPKAGNASLKIPATINGFYDKTSWGKLQWLAHVAGVGGLNATQWFTLPKAKTGYANCGFSDVCANLTLLFTDAMTLAKNAGVNLTTYDNINVVVNNDLDCCAWGGGATFEGKFYGATWEPPWGQETSTYVHEFGHSLGLPHSGWVYSAYDSPWDEMSTGSPAQSIVCGTYKSANNANAVRNINCTEPGGGYITAHKNFLGWIPPANQIKISDIGTRVVNLASNTIALGANTKMVKICLAGKPCDAQTNAQYLTVEARFKNAQYDKGLPSEGVIIHDVKMNRAPIGGTCFFNSSSGWAVPIDSTKNDYDSVNCGPGNRTYPNYGLFNAQFGVGKTYNNAALGVKVEVLSKTTTVFRVRITKTK